MARNPGSRLRSVLEPAQELGVRLEPWWPPRPRGPPSLVATAGVASTPRLWASPVLGPGRREAPAGGLDGEPLGGTRGGELDDVGVALRGMEEEIERAEAAVAGGKAASDVGPTMGDEAPFLPCRRGSSGTTQEAAETSSREECQEGVAITLRRAAGRAGGRPASPSPGS